MHSDHEKLSLSVIVPAFNEADCLPTLVDSLLETLQLLDQQFEIILVNDASTDRTADVIRELCKNHPEVHGVHHRINSGQSAAVMSGAHVACGRLLVTMDADLQNPPSEIPLLLSNLTPETAAVCGVRINRDDHTIRRISSKVANAVRDLITGVQVRDAGCGLRLIRRSAMQELPVFNGLHRFIPTILRLQGFTVKEIPVAHNSRLAGMSKYGIGNRLWRGLADCFAMRWYAHRVIYPQRTGIFHE